jgi:hypothetical protein
MRSISYVVLSQGCEERATLGIQSQSLPNAEGVEFVLQDSGIQPFQGWGSFHSWTQGSPSQNRANPGLKDSIPSGLTALCPCKDTSASGIELKTVKNQSVGHAAEPCSRRGHEADLTTLRLVIWRMRN